ncbi:nuclear transport factor 2 family protein [Tsukamurella spumae]|uniref:Nuclear transport factor 2 family protein n=1 Tax=Tsukamurella spumae TaxID=44753 RepID=A0A846WYJ7_9ACTN|nr:nuclear transport factor 2 family protein [Tsukamurella spumae]NKY17169.1 nuclear transport factor 2 family protein [Tsukamurella spumae]
MREFRTAVEARDGEAFDGLLADDVTFTSPVAFTPYQGRHITAAILRGVLGVFEDFHYVREINDGADHALLFEAVIGDTVVNGCDFIHVNDAGKIDDFMVMVRPLSAAKALAAAMGARFESIKEDAVARARAEAR